MARSAPGGIRLSNVQVTPMNNRRQTSVLETAEPVGFA
jgi:hypothetical protein